MLGKDYMTIRTTYITDVNSDYKAIATFHEDYYNFPPSKRETIGLFLLRYLDNSLDNTLTYSGFYQQPVNYAPDTVYNEIAQITRMMKWKLYG